MRSFVKNSIRAVTYLDFLASEDSVGRSPGHNSVGDVVW